MVLLCFFARTRGGLGGKTERVVGAHSNPIAAAAATAADLLSLAGANGAAEIDAEASSITRVKCACEASSAAGRAPTGTMIAGFIEDLLHPARFSCTFS